MIDTASYLNSKDIAEHWRSIGFVCTPLQNAYIVWQNHTKTLQEKHAAWREIIEIMPDCIVAEGHRKTNIISCRRLNGCGLIFLRRSERGISSFPDIRHGVGMCMPTSRLF